MKDAHEEKELQRMVDDIERDLLFCMITAGRHDAISLSESRELASDFLAMLPVFSKRELLSKLIGLGKKYPEVKSVFLKYAEPYDTQKSERALFLMNLLIKNGDFDKAVDIGREALE